MRRTARTPTSKKAQQPEFSRSGHLQALRECGVKLPQDDRQALRLLARGRRRRPGPKRKLGPECPYDVYMSDCFRTEASWELINSEAASRFLWLHSWLRSRVVWNHYRAAQGGRGDLSTKVGGIPISLALDLLDVRPPKTSVPYIGLSTPWLLTIEALVQIATTLGLAERVATLPTGKQSRRGPLFHPHVWARCLATWDFREAGHSYYEIGVTLGFTGAAHEVSKKAHQACERAQVMIKAAETGTWPPNFRQNPRDRVPK